MKIIIDMNMTPDWIDLFARVGVDAFHWSMLGAQDAQDTEILDYARLNQFVVLTHDLDFGTILAATSDASPSVIQIRTADVSPTYIGNQVVAAVLLMANELEQGALLTLGPARSRVRLLPF